MNVSAFANPFGMSDTIVAQATAPGRGALAIVRLSGPDSHNIARDTLDVWPTAPRQVRLSTVRDPAGEVLDQSIVIRYDAPASFTGENAVELVTHGGVIVPITVVAAFIARGARMALPGEFTRRAVLNGKLDILQAEATGDLVNADSRSAQRTAIQQLDGGLSRRVLALRADLLGLEALIAYDLDFPEEDDGPIAPERVRRSTEAVIDDLGALLATARAGELVREGALVVLAGAPNVGKSSLFNALLGRRRAIVTDIPGTTRDAIEAVIDTGLLPLRLVDTAGLRDAVDPVERMGVEVSESYIDRASVVLACADSVETAGAIGAVIARGRAPVIAVRTKSDRSPPSSADLAAIESRVHSIAVSAVSAETGEGLADLMTLIEQTAARDAPALGTDTPLLTQQRHRYAVSRALDEVRAFRDSWQTGVLPVPVAAVHLREAVTSLEDLIGAVGVDDVLDEVFRRFCVGK